MITVETFHVKVRLECSLVHLPSYEIDAEIHRRLCLRYGDRCNSRGYIYGESIVIKCRSAGVVDNLVVDGGANYEVQYVATVVSPQQGDRFDCVVLNKNKEGIQCRANASSGIPCLNHLDVILPIQWHDKPTQTYLQRDVKTNDNITVEVMGTRFQPGERSIRVVVQYLSNLTNT